MNKQKNLAKYLARIAVTTLGVACVGVLGFVYFNNLPDKDIRANKLSGVNDYDFYARYNRDFELQEKHFLDLIKDDTKDIEQIRIDSLPLHSHLKLDGVEVREGQLINVEDISKLILRPFVDQYDRLGWSAFDGDKFLPKIETNIGVGAHELYHEFAISPCDTDISDNILILDLTQFHPINTSGGGTAQSDSASLISNDPGLTVSIDNNLATISGLTNSNQSFYYSISIDADFGGGPVVFSEFANMNVLATQTGDCDDGDGVALEVEDAGPNFGDSNDDGVMDSEQSNVATLLDSNGSYVSINIDGAGCTQLQDVSSMLETDVSLQDSDYDFPLGLIGFEVPCTGPMTVTHYWYGADPEVDYVYLKFGNLVPGDSSTAQWYDWEVDMIPITIGGEYVLQVTYTLMDGEFGDDSGVDGVIVDPAGLTIAPIISTDETETATDDESDTDNLIRTGGFSNSQKNQTILLVGLVAMFISWFRLENRSKRIYNK